MSRQSESSSSTEADPRDLDVELIQRKIDTLSESVGAIIEENTRLRDKVKALTEKLLQKEIDTSRVVTYKDYANILEAKESAVMMWREALKEIARLTEKAKLVERYEAVIKEYEEQFQTISKQFEESQNTRREIEQKATLLSREKEELEKDIVTKTKYIDVCEAKLRKEEEMHRHRSEERAKEYASAKKAFEDRISELLGVIEDLEGKNKTLEESQQRAQEVANDCIRKTQELTLQAAVLEQQKQASDKETADLQEKHAKMLLENEEAIRKIKSTMTRDHEKMKEEFERKLRALNEELQDKTSELKLTHKRLLELQDQNARLTSEEFDSSAPWQLKYKLQKAEEHVHHLETSLRQQEQRALEQEAYYRKQIKGHLECIDTLKRELESTQVELLETKRKLASLDHTYHLQKVESKTMQKKFKSKIEKLEEALQEQKLRYAAILRKQESNLMIIQMKELIQDYEFIIKEMKRHMDNLLETIETQYQTRSNLMHVQESKQKLAEHSGQDSEHVLKTQKQLREFSLQVDRLGQQFQEILRNINKQDGNNDQG